MRRENNSLRRILFRVCRYEASLEQRFPEFFAGPPGPVACKVEALFRRCLDFRAGDRLFTLGIRPFPLGGSVLEVEAKAMGDVPRRDESLLVELDFSGAHAIDCRLSSLLSSNCQVFWTGLSKAKLFFPPPDPAWLMDAEILSPALQDLMGCGFSPENSVFIDSFAGFPVFPETDGVEAPGKSPLSLNHSVPGLVGLGPGLTPLGDDILLGLMAAWTARVQADSRLSERLTELRHCLKGQLSRTTVQSARMLDFGLRGIFPEALCLVSKALAVDNFSSSGCFAEALELCLATGHTSGRGMLIGFLAGL